MFRHTKKVRFLQFYKRFCADQSGATAIEYGVLIAILSLGLIAGQQGFGGKIAAVWQVTAGELATT